MFEKKSQGIINSPLPLLLLGGASLAIYLSIRFLALDLLGGELDTLLNRFPHSIYFISDFFHWLFLFFTLVLIWAVKKSKSLSFSSSYWIIAIVFFILFSIVLMTTPPLTSQDVFWNLFQGRIFSHYQQNPYLVTPQDFPGDPSLGLIRVWQDFPMTHGPIWTLLLAGVSALFPDNLFLQVLLLRTVLFLFLGMAIYFLILIIRQLNPNWSFPAFIAISWQPLLLVYTLNAAHNDILIGLAAFVGLFLIFQKRYLRGFAVLWLGVLVKYVILLLIPLGIMALIRHNLSYIVKISLSIFGVITLLTLLFYLPFGYNLNQLRGLNYQSRLFEYTTLPPVPFWLTTIGAVSMGINIKGILLQDKQISLTNFNDSLGLLVTIIRILSIVVFSIFYFWLLFKPFQNERDIFKRGFGIFITYLLVAPLWFMAWYLIWLVPLAVVSGLWPTLIALGLSILAFPYPFPMLQIVTPLLVAAAFLILLTRKKKLGSKKLLDI